MVWQSKFPFLLTEYWQRKDCWAPIVYSCTCSPGWTFRLSLHPCPTLDFPSWSLTSFLPVIFELDAWNFWGWHATRLGVSSKGLFSKAIEVFWWQLDFVKTKRRDFVFIFSVSMLLFFTKNLTIYLRPELSYHQGSSRPDSGLTHPWCISPFIFCWWYSPILPFGWGWRCGFWCFWCYFEVLWKNWRILIRRWGERRLWVRMFCFTWKGFLILHPFGETYIFY